MNIKDNPPLLPTKRLELKAPFQDENGEEISGVYFHEAEYLQGQAAAFDRGVVACQEAMQEEIARLKLQLDAEMRHSEILRAKLKVLEEQKPVATKIKWFDLATRKETVKIVEHVDSNLPIGTVFYTAAGAKHD